MTTNITTVINGIEIKTMGDGVVEVYSDRPSMVRIKDLVEILTSTETSMASETHDCFLQSHGMQHEGSSRRVEPA